MDLSGTDDHTFASERIVEFFRAGSYTGSGRDHIDQLCSDFLSDLTYINETVSEAAHDGQLVFERNFSPSGHQFNRDIDLVVGSPSSTPQQQLTEATIQEGSVDEVWLALNVESLISSVGKNWKNRGEDIYVFYLTVYDNYSVSATGSIILLNIGDLTNRDPEEIVNGFGEFEFASGSIAQTIDGLAVIPIDYDSETPGDTRIVDDLVSEDHPLHYRSFVEVMGKALARRFEGKFRVTEDSLEALLAQQESEVLEFKRELDDLDNIAKEATALANHEGGSIIIGVEDDGSVRGLDDIVSAEERVSGILKNISPSVIQNIEKARVEADDILIITVGRSTKIPASFQGTFYVRRGTTKARMTGDDILRRFPRD